MNKTVLNVESFRPVPGFEELYECSTHGTIKSVDRITPHNARRNGVVLSPKFNRGGYMQVTLYKFGKQKMITVHRLVALTWVDGYFEGAVINHIDEDKTNNHYTNLEWCTIAHNNQHSKTKNYKVVSPDNKEFEINNMRAFCRDNGLCQSNMTQVSKGKKPNYKGWSCEELK